MEEKKVLVCFTNSYPYGGRETYFETELQYLSEGFDEVIILPKYNPYKTDVQRNIPENVKICKPLVPTNKIVRFFSGVFNRSPFTFYIKDLFKNRVYLSISKLKIWGRSLLMYRSLYSKVLPLLNELDENTVLYSYWAEAPIFITKMTGKFKKAVRMHRGDFYISEYGGYLPVRDCIYRNAHLLLPISEEIASILKEYYNISQKKIVVNYLGVGGLINKDQVRSKPNETIVVVSCSRVDNIKRVDLIAKAIMMSSDDREVEWHHFGDGTEFVELKEMTKVRPSHVKIYIHGWTEQKTISEFYKMNYVTWFVNVSKHEGVPVSIMEAMSFGIPVIATDVGATRELVCEKNGFLVKEDISDTKLSTLLTEDQGDEYVCKRTNAYLTWENKFNAEKNFTTLVNKLISLNPKI